MPPRAATSLLVVTRLTVLRADFTAGANPTLLGTWSEPRPTSLDDLPSLVEAAIVLGPGKLGKKVWVLAGDLWTQNLAMAQRTTAKLSDADLANALGFEVETLSGIGAFESVVGYLPVPSTKADETGFWVVQVRLGDREQLDEIVAKNGGKLAGILHPGGLPLPLTPAAANEPAWQRVELWSDVIVCLHGTRGKPVQVHLINADPRHERWQAEEEDWRQQMGTVRHREMLLTTGEIVTFNDAGQPQMGDEVDDSRAVWLTAWAKELHKGRPPVPMVLPLVKPMSQNMRLALAGGLAVLVLGLCFAHFLYATVFQLTLTKLESQRLKGPLDRLQSLEQQAQKLEKDLAAERKQVDEVRQTNEALQAQRQRLARLLLALSAQLPDDLLVQKIEGEIGKPVIHGLCLYEKQANQFAARLAKELPSDWQVKETRLKAQEKLTNSGPFEFQVHLTLTLTGPVAAPGPGAAGKRPPIFEE